MNGESDRHFNLFFKQYHCLTVTVYTPHGKEGCGLRPLVTPLGGVSGYI